MQKPLNRGRVGDEAAFWLARGRGLRRSMGALCRGSNRRVNTSAHAAGRDMQEREELVFGPLVHVPPKASSRSPRTPGESLPAAAL
jgi:hypothetical protein